MKNCLSIIALATAAMSYPASSSDSYGVSIEAPTTPFEKYVATYYPEFKGAYFINFNAKKERNSSVVMLQKDLKLSSSYYAAAEIGVNGAGARSLYLVEYDVECSDDDEDKVVLNVSGQNVFFYRFCDTVYQYTPATTAGQKYVIDTFNKSKHVTITGLTYPLIFDATGFTDRWNDFGGDAL